MMRKKTEGLQLNIRTVFNKRDKILELLTEDQNHHLKNFKGQVSQDLWNILWS